MINVNATRQRTWVPFATVFFAMVLLVIPAPELIRDFLPDWVSLVLIYWALALPTRMGCHWPGSRASLLICLRWVFPAPMP
ncbi:MAG: rod shape-determining protein MreD [Arenicellales bacterium]